MIRFRHNKRATNTEPAFNTYEYVKRSAPQTDNVAHSGTGFYLGMNKKYARIFKNEKQAKEYIKPILQHWHFSCEVMEICLVSPETKEKILLRKHENGKKIIDNL